MNGKGNLKTQKREGCMFTLYNEPVDKIVELVKLSPNEADTRVEASKLVFRDDPYPSAKEAAEDCVDAIQVKLP